MDFADRRGVAISARRVSFALDLLAAIAAVAGARRLIECGAMSHGIAWDDKRERLVLLVNLGDCVYAHRLLPDDLTSDPVVTATDLIAKAKPELAKSDTDLI